LSLNTNLPSNNQAVAYAGAMNLGAMKEAKRRRAQVLYRQRFHKYQADPLRFCSQELDAEFTDEVQEVLLSVRDHPVTIARSGNGVGKSFAAAHAAVYWFKCFPEAQVYLTAAPPLDNLKSVLWGEIMTLYHKHPAVFYGDQQRTLEIASAPLHFIKGVAIPTSGSPEERQAKFSGKHSSYLLFIVDEGDAVPDEVYKGIESCMSGGMARLLIMFNPRAERGPVYFKEKTGAGHVVHLSALDHPNVTTGLDLIPGAVNREITVRRIQEWTRPLMEEEQVGDLERFMVPEFLVGSVAAGQDGALYPPLPAGERKIVEPQFYYMVLGKYPAQDETQLISEAWIWAARERWDAYVALHGETPPSASEVLMGVDVAELGTDYNVACFRYGSFVARFLPWAGLDGHATAMKCLKLYRAKGVTFAAIDASAYGSTIAPIMARTDRDQKTSREAIRVAGIKASEAPQAFVRVEWGEFYQLRDQLWWAVREWLRTDPQAMLPPDELLLEELKVATYGVDDRTNKIKILRKDDMRALLRRSPDRADALCLTFNPIRRANVRRLVGES